MAVADRDGSNVYFYGQGLSDAQEHVQQIMERITGAAEVGASVRGEVVAVFTEKIIAKSIPSKRFSL